MEQFNGEVASRLLRHRRKFIGSGAYGVVALVEWRREPVALKISRSSLFSKSFSREADILALLKGAGGAPLLLGVAVNPFALLITYKGSQTLQNLFNDPEYNLIDLGLQVGRKLLEIHKAGIVHNDIKGSNIMVQGPPHNPEISIIDFGMACKTDESVLLFGDPNVSTIHAPEMIERGCSSFASDVFSYGVLMLQILNASPTTMTLPLTNPSIGEVIEEAMHPNPQCRPSLPDLLRRLQENMNKNSSSELQDGVDLQRNMDGNQHPAQRCGTPGTQMGTPHKVMKQSQRLNKNCVLI
ncbi:probable serine/threonine-protein kinase DDB_G0271682 [Procambarus clarkii]|uniref:probable serine/threonine-protein kinase DDB_G0271682 n=1 Tax=Procambarus clarkii TaxID=6728 RepID=UPI001E677613|nr:probable serine/threonine-protein kinase DDB_G0271682 [Procambarus clarkii]